MCLLAHINFNKTRSAISAVLNTAKKFRRGNQFHYNDQGKISLYFGSEREVHNTVLVWGCVSSSHPKALLLRVNEKFNSATYKEILQKHILPLSDKDQSQPIGLVHDWFPGHRSKAVIEFAKGNKEKMTFLDWPKYFGNIMPVEDVWFKMMNNFSRGNVKFQKELISLLPFHLNPAHKVALSFAISGELVKTREAPLFLFLESLGPV
ncbi:hypothetical protein OUZ56_011329 [Daphnia magna]|uniref:Tc1-like transposase DDE domain-containing protein n=1 Tax=Daphnia magna TaxID=35525 RepID=A0ABQ9Z029_9CRUS|nr:hypothetical protein OUZ56_011329 [Daphnia magna]